MSIRSKPFVSGEYYHLYNRGNSKQQIFHDEQDYMLFIKLLFILNKTKNIRVNDLVNLPFHTTNDPHLVSIGAYVLMPNHFHILITPTENGDISKFIQKVCTAYVMYYNKKYNRTGGLFEGKFKSKYLDTDNYLKYIFSYIHLNPIKLIDKNWKEVGIKDLQKSLDFLKNYKYSSYLDYLYVNSRSQELVLDRKAFPDYFPSEKSFNREILDWLNYSE